MKHVTIIVQARMGSTRLPGKVLREVCGKSLLEHLVSRLRALQSNCEIRIATTTDPRDDIIVEKSKSLNVSVTRGSEEDVLDRYVQAMKESGADIGVRITADCPLMEAKLIDRVLQEFLKGGWDYCSNTLERTFPRGLDIEVFSKEALFRASSNASNPQDREHVTPYIYKNPALFKIGQLKNDVDLSRHRWTVDTAEDFELIRRIVEALYPQNPDFHMADVLTVLDNHPDWFAINAHVEQKAH